jgi:DNA polymerase (family 10)
MDNNEIAAIFYEVADILDLQGVAFKPNAYRRAARSIESLEEDISKVAAEGKLAEIPGVGESVAKKIEEIIRTGQLSYLRKLRAEIPPGLLEILSIPDIGPKTAMLLNRELGIQTLDQLKKAAEEHRLRGIKGFGEKSEEKVLQGIKMLETKGTRMLLGEAYPIGNAYVDHLKLSGTLNHVSVGGSLRRGKETIGDIDILVGDDEPAKVMEAFVAYPKVKDVMMRGPTKSSVMLEGGVQVDLRVVDPKSWGAALVYFTGSKDHNVAIRSIGVQMSLKLNEYGLFERDSGKMIAGGTEEDVYEALGLHWMPPEIREASGEIEASKANKLPALVGQAEIKGDFHTHTEWSDGSETIEVLLNAALSRGYEYVAVTDHSQSLKIANGLTPERLRKQTALLRKAEKNLDGRMRVLSGSEVDIKPDGSLDFPPSTLRELDLVIGSVHSRFKMDRNEMTKRITTAVESGSIDILGHPTGRLIGERDPYDFDLEKVFSAAKSSGVCMELNCFPNRLDLRDVHCRLAGQRGVKVALGTDSHRTEQLDFIKYGVTTARRGWLEKESVLNTLNVKDLNAFLRRRRR